MSNRQVAKNALYLYLRTIVTTIVGIYTSRVVLQTLGIEDYGLYNVVGGVVGLFGFINGAMSGSTSRFITFELGKGDKQRLHDTFNSAMIVHLIISGIVLILAETVGLWFLYNKLVIPEGRMWAAQWVYQLSIISALLGVTQVPYDAVLIAHERFDVSAYISMFSTFAKLGVLYLVAYLPYDNLISYAILILLITVLTRMFARFYCAKHFEESRFRWVVNRELLKPMLNFSGWQMLGNIGQISKEQGFNFLVNMFWGLTVNAAVSIGNTFAGAINGFAYNIVAAFRPLMIKVAAQNKQHRFEKVVELASNFSFLLYSVFSIPLIIERNFILNLWLGNVPEYAPEICGIHLLFFNFSMISIVLSSALQALGKNKKQNAFVFFVGMISLFGIYLMCLHKLYFEMIVCFCDLAVFAFLLYNMLLLSRYMSKSFFCRFMKNVVCQSLFLYVFRFFILIEIKNLITESFLRLMVVSVVSVCLGFLTHIVFFRKDLNDC